MKTIMEPQIEPSLEAPIMPSLESQIEPSMEPSMEPPADPIIHDAPTRMPSTPRKDRLWKYYTEEKAKDMGRLQRKLFKQHYSENQKVFKSGISELQLSVQKLLIKVVLSKEDLIRIIVIIEGKMEMIGESIQTV
ncbi:MAG: hypothetical protein EZS28_039847 [Streblomastix strix]|uniref:Uncharacterized protein n=1 Tax=Streblomastix strix TaxID=222440 RepID=A0A5J4U1M8_9EUKA|nr:MAG: hypothetical protein EZS28_039847 [Streblomastix strix]